MEHDKVAERLRELLTATAEQSAAVALVWQEIERQADWSETATRLLTQAQQFDSPLLTASAAGVLLCLLREPDRSTETELAAQVSALGACRPVPADCLSVSEACNRLVTGGATLALADCAVELLQDCLSRLPADSAERPALLAVQANAWRLRYLRNGAETDLSRAVAAVDEAHALAGPEHPLHARIRHSRATVHDLVGGPDRIGSRHRASAEDGDTDPGTRGRALLSTITELLARFRKSQDTGALDEALALAGQALDPAFQNAGERWFLLMRAAQPYAVKGWHTKDAELLARSIELLREALDLLPAGHALAVGLLNELGSSLHLRALVRDDEGELATALSLLRRSVERTPHASADYASFSSNFAMGLWTLWKRGRSPAVLAEAVRVATDARDSAAANPTSRQHLGHLEGLVGTLTGLWVQHYPATAGRHEQARAGLAAAMRLGGETVNSVLTGSMSVALAAAAEDWSLATDLSAQVIELLPHVASPALSLRDRERGLAGLTTDLARDACACALTTGSPQRALELLEQGRATLIDQALAGRQNHDLDLIRPYAPAEAVRMAELREQLAETGEARHGAATDRRHTLADEMLRLTRTIRSLPGLERYLLPPRLADVRTRLGSDPLVVINVSRHRCDALIVTGSRDVTVVPLPDLTLEEAGEHAAGFTAAVTRLSDRPGPRERKQLTGALRETLAWLWEVVSEPVLTALGVTSATDDPPRVHWSPTGPLVFLPLHAAERDGNCVLDRVVSSYVPTLRLLPARREPPATGPSLIVSVPRSTLLPGRPLDEAAHEVEALVRAFPESVLLEHDDADAGSVLAALGRSRRVHFACHGETDAHHPSNSHLVLQNERLTVSDLMRQRLDSLDLAVLSACHTARGSEHMPDEMLHLTSALQIAGVRHTVGTLWQAGDKSARRFTELFYQNLQGGHPVAAAVHAAARTLRGESTTPAAWAPFIHVGS
ncbi:CHAT domain-containing protein [Nonomuraea sp. NPDC001699]